MKTLSFSKKQVLITVKAYPNPSFSYGETVCCAGIDLETLTWIRLYPISYRDLDSKKKFLKYSIIEVECAKAEDKRPESFRVREDSIRILDRLGTTPKEWERRKSIVSALPIVSLCGLKKSEIEMGTSLGLIKPSDVRFLIKKRIESDPARRALAYAQGSIFKRLKDPIEEIPYVFYYRFKCSSTPNCTGHELSIIDWEINQAYRMWRTKYKTDDLLLEKIREKWELLANPAVKNVNFYTGNMAAHPRSFLILGTFSPKLK